MQAAFLAGAMWLTISIRHARYVYELQLNPTNLHQAGTATSWYESRLYMPAALLATDAGR
jgi:hypothetical protein